VHRNNGIVGFGEPRLRHILDRNRAGAGEHNRLH
jgi:hypothetical protein